MFKKQTEESSATCVLIIGWFFLTFSAILDKVSLLEHQPLNARSYYIKQCLLRLFVFTVGAVVVEYGPNIKYAFCSHPGIQSCKKMF